MEWREARDETKRLASRRQTCRGVNSRGVAMEEGGRRGDMKAESRNSNTTEMDEGGQMPAIADLIADRWMRDRRHLIACLVCK